MGSSEALNEYVKTRSPEAFRAIVDAYVNIVYASARRQLHDAHLAEDVTQTVFCILAQKAQTISPGRPLSAWLLTTTRYVVSNARRSRARRGEHERRATEMASTQTSDPETWNDVSPLLDEGITKLSDTDRDVILLRFFEQKTARETGAALGISEDAAEKRVSRAIDRLRDFLARRGVRIASTALAAGLARHMLFDAPPALAASITATSTAKIALTTQGGIMAATKLKIAAGIVAALATAGVSVVIVQKLNALDRMPASPATQVAPNPAGAQNSDDFYKLRPDEPIRIIRNAPQAVRQEMWARLQAPDVRRPTVEPADGAIIFEWSDGKPQNPILFTTGIQITYDLAIRQLAGLTTGFGPYEIEVPDNLPADTLAFPGDIAYTRSVPRDRTLAALETLLSEELKMPVRLKEEMVERKVFVLKGIFKYTPAKGSEAITTPRFNGKPVQVIFDLYGSDPINPKGLMTASLLGSGVANPDEIVSRKLADAVARWIGDRQVIIEATGFPTEIGWRFHNPTSPQHLTAAHDAQSVLTHLSEQTGLTLTEETRTVRRLIVTVGPPS